MKLQTLDLFPISREEATHLKSFVENKFGRPIAADDLSVESLNRALAAVVKSPTRRSKKASNNLSLIRSWLDAQLRIDFDAPPANDAEVSDEKVEWSLADVLTLHEGVLKQHIHLLKDTRTKASLRHDLTVWLTRPVVPAEQAIKEPFSFSACAYACGVDAEALQSLLVTELTKTDKLDTSVVFH